MTIAAHFDTSDKHPSFLHECISRLAAQNSDDHFIIFTHKENNTLNLPTENCTLVEISPSIKNSLLLHYWYNFKLPAFIQKYNVDIFITENSICSLRCKAAQIMIIKDDFLLHKKYPVKNDFQRYIKKYFVKCCTKTAAICVSKKFIETGLLLKYPALKNKIKTILHGIHPVGIPIATAQKESLLNKYTDGHEYFVFECSAFTQKNLLPLLKAFSLFKKRLKSDMKLVIINKMDNLLVKDFHLYKYKNDVLVIPFSTQTDMGPLIASAYTAIHLPDNPIEENTGFQYLQSAVPLIITESERHQLIFTDAAIFTAISATSISEKMMQLYKDENLRNSYIQKGLAVAEPYNWSNCSHNLWQTILQCSRV